MIGRALQWERLLESMVAHTDDMVDLLQRLITLESPSGDDDAQAAVLDLVAAEAERRNLPTTVLSGSATGDHLLVGSPPDGDPYQLLLVHSDTVWNKGTLDQRPIRLEEGRLYGPGAYDAKAGLVQALHAIDAVRGIAEVSPVLLINSDEEIGSRSSRPHIEALAKGSDRVLVLEPSLGPRGQLKVARKGLGRYTVTVAGRAAHAGLDPERGASAVLELAHVVQYLFSLNDSKRGLTVNVGTIDGGLRPNVIADEARAVVDVRARTEADAEEVDRAIRAVPTTVPGTTATVTGGFGRRPMEPSAGTTALFNQAQSISERLGFRVTGAEVGGGSDGNLTAGLAPTLDGLGAVGDGAHSEDEHVAVKTMPERAALLTGLLAQPALVLEGNTEEVIP